ncbi:MAG: MmcQ/YjbR family DNA-binding protein [Acholeplasmataceae bacterium]|nr:MmcQ/YjbR family DNA-binding protein [Acholeplasmataceae bacterium]
MKYLWIDEYLINKKNIVKDFQMDWQATRYLLEGKMVAMVGQDKEKRDIMSLKLDPTYGQFLRSEYKDIRPGYFLNKEHWNSIDLNGLIEDDLLKELIDQSYQLILKSFSKAKQKEMEKR